MMPRHFLISLLTAAITGTCLGACSGRGTGSPAAGFDSLPPVVQKLTEAITDSDPTAFARLVSYPIQRPYPLHDITDAEEMRHYYTIIADDSLRNVIATAKPSDWSAYGWRGWSLHDGNYIWVYDSIYSITYVSPLEQKMRRRLIGEELSSLAPALQGSWEPVCCMTQADGMHVFRIDRSLRGNGRNYRLAIFASREQMRGKPEQTLNGVRDVEGSIGIISYVFNAPDNRSLTFTPETADGSLPNIVIAAPDGNDSIITVKMAYWLDLLPAHVSQEAEHQQLGNDHAGKH